MNQRLTPYEKKALANCFNLKSLSPNNQKFFYNLLFNYLDDFPILNEMARNLIKKTRSPIRIKIEKLDNIGGYHWRSEICFDSTHYNTHAEKQVASTLWHETLHYLQSIDLENSSSKRGYILYRQFIEAEAKAISSLISPSSQFERDLYSSVKNKFSNTTDAQKFYIGCFAKLIFHADRDLAKQEAKNIMGNSFNEAVWQSFNSKTMQRWQDYYYQYHAGHINSILPSNFKNKSSKDKKLIENLETYFLNKYGVQLSAKSSISEDILNRYNMTKKIENTILVPTEEDEVFNIKNWRIFPTGKQTNAYMLDLPNMSKSYIQTLKSILKKHNINATENIVTHRTGSASRCLIISHHDVESVKRFESLCHINQNGISDSYKNDNVPPKRPPMPPLPPIPPLPKKDVFLKKGETHEINPNQPPVLYMGEKYGIAFKLKNFLTKKRINFLKSGGVMLIGRNPLSKQANIPPEIKNFHGPVKLYQFPQSDSFVSNIHGYFYMGRNGKFYYKDFSSNGSKISFNAKNTFQRDLAFER